MRLPGTSDIVVYFALTVLIYLAVIAFISPAHCKRDGGFWADGECHYGLDSVGSVRKVRK